MKFMVSIDGMNFLVEDQFPSKAIKKAIEEFEKNHITFIDTITCHAITHEIK